MENDLKKRNLLLVINRILHLLSYFRLMIRKITVVGIVAVVAITLLAFLIWNTKQSRQPPDGSPRLTKIARLLEVADSIKSIKPDSSLIDYGKAISLLQKSEKNEVSCHLLAKSYSGMSYIYAEKGESKIAIKNDSLAMEIASANDDKPIIAKSLIIWGMLLSRQGEYDSALDCYQKALVRATELKDIELQAKIAANRATIYSLQGNNPKTIEGFKQALILGKQLRNDPLIAANYLNLAVVYMNLSKNDSGLIYSNLALELFKKNNDKNGQIKCYRNIGNIYYGLSDFGKTIQFYKLSLQLAIEMNDQINVAKSYHNLSEIYLHLGDNATATDLLFKSIRIKEQQNDQLSLAKGYTGLAKLYFARKEYPKALIYFRKALQINLKLKSVSEIGSNYNSIASVYCSINKTDSAIVFYNKALELYQQINFKYGISNICINLGDVYRGKQDFRQAEKLFDRALKTKTEIGEEEGVAVVNSMLANLYFTMANRQADNQSIYLLEKAEKTGLESFKTAKRLGSLPVMSDISSCLMEIYQKQGRYPEALEYSKIHNALSDSILNKDKIEALTFAEARWNAGKKQDKIDDLENTKRLNREIIHQDETESRQQKLIIWFIVGLFLLTVISAVVVILYLRKRREAIIQKQLTKMSALRLQNARNTMSPHFFFNVLASLSGLSANPVVLKEKLKSLSLLLRKVIENIDRTAITLNDELAAVKAYIDLYRDKIQGPFTMDYLIGEETKLDGLVPAMIIQIPVENAIKHGLMPLEGDKKLIIRVTGFKEYQQITITDNGIGLKAAAGHSSGTGSGLKVLKQTIQLLNANNKNKIGFSIDEREPNHAGATGTVVEIQIPYEYNYTI